jgi:phosphopantothenoylcysteine decarboxylase/phosphopantothenate--cysteine ligase
VLVTAGGTREPIDSVRYIGNSSSGRMGFALAEAAQRAARDVTLSRPTSRSPRPPACARRRRHGRRAEEACEEPSRAATCC